MNGSNEGIRSLYYKCREQIKKVSEAGEKTGFLVMGILKYTFDQALPLMLVPLEDLLHGDYKPLERAKKFLDFMENDPYLAAWKEKEVSYRKLLESLGMSIDGTDYSNLSVIADPLTNALTFYQNKRLKIYQARTGKRSTARPVLMNEVCKFRSEKEFADTITSCGRECVIAFGGIEKTNRQQKDYFSDYLRNTSGKSPWWNSVDTNSEEYLSEISKSSRQILLCVKAGECIYLVWMPYDGEYYRIEKDQVANTCTGEELDTRRWRFFTRSPQQQKQTPRSLQSPKKHGN